MSGEAFTLRLKLAKLMQRHGIAPPASFSVPLFDPVDGPLTLAGLASTSDIDFGRQKFRPYCFDNLCLTLKGYPFPKLYMKHDEIKGRRRDHFPEIRRSRAAADRGRRHRRSRQVLRGVLGRREGEQFRDRQP